MSGPSACTGMIEGGKFPWCKPWEFLLIRLGIRRMAGAESDKKGWLPSELVDVVQARLQPFWTAYGFRGHGRNFSRKSFEGLTQVINFRVSPWGLSSDGCGRFTLNAGIFLPDVRPIVTGKKLPLAGQKQEARHMFNAEIARVSKFGGSDDITEVKCAAERLTMKLD